MELSWTGTRFELRCTFAEKELPKKSGFHWDGRLLVWWTGRTELAKKFSQFANERAKAMLNRAEEEIKLSQAVSANVEIPVPPGLSYLPFQKAGILFALPKANVLIADEMGLGKTISAIGVINADSTIKKTLVICPASLKLNWVRELRKWIVRKMTGEIATSSNLPKTDIVIVNYEIVNKLRKEIDKRQWDLIIMDESHYMKNPAAQRTKAVLGADFHGKTVKAPIYARRRIFLTGTPILNHPIELWPMLRVADPEGLGANHWRFAKRYCAAWESPWGWDFRGASNLEELQNSLRSTLMVRRLKKDVLTELPPKRRQIIPLPSDIVKSIITKEKEFYETNSIQIEEARKKAEEAQAVGNNESYKKATDELQSAQRMLFEQMAALRHTTAVAKIPFVIDILQDALEQEEKVVVFAHHQDVVNQLLEKFRDTAVKFDGTMNSLERQMSVDKFQNDPKVKLFIGSITAAGLGITLTAASYVLFAELDWRPAIVTQAEDRLHRIGQTESVLVQHLVFDGSLDATMAQTIVKKQEVIDKVLDKPKEVNEKPNGHTHQWKRTGSFVGTEPYRWQATCLCGAEALTDPTDPTKMVIQKEGNNA